MNLGIGIVGLPNVGKSTLFNALLKKQQALVANYPFATIEPNIGVVAVPDKRLARLAEITKEEEKMLSLPPIKPATVNFVDIAGLVKGASEGAGLGNKFLANIRETSIICHVVRTFTDDNVLREGSSDPESDFASIETELLLADLQSALNHLSKTKIQSEKLFTQRIIDELNTGTPVRDMRFSKEEQEVVRQMFYLTSKAEIIVLNVNEDEYNKEQIVKITERYSNLLTISKNKFVVICAKIEVDLAGLDEEEQKEYLRDLGLEKSGLERLIQKAYEELGLISFLTTGEKETRAWTIKKGSTAVEASGEIHTDFMKKFIKAEVVHYEDFVEFKGWKSAREHGKALLEGRDYRVNDGDIIEFKIGA
jgi:ribosome-binding ATPase